MVVVVMGRGMGGRGIILWFEPGSGDTYPSLTLCEHVHAESVKITKQPEATPGVEGQQLILECRATGVPKPNFLWFKAPNTPLPEQCSDQLILSCLTKEDSTKYCCRAENEVNTVFSAWVEIKVQKPHIVRNGGLML